MGTLDKSSYLLRTKELIKEALIEKGVEVSDTDTFRSYASKVKSISTAEDLSVELAEQDAAITELEEVANSLPDAGIINPDVPTDPTDPPVFGFGTFNENGEYNAEDYGVDGWSSIKVEVAGSGGDTTDLDYIKYEDLRIWQTTGKPVPTDTEYEEIINKGYDILDCVFGG